MGPLPQYERGDSYNGILIESIVSYRGALLATLGYAIDRLNQKGVYSNVISFCARVLALCFFKIPSVGFVLLQALPVNKLHIKRMLTETLGNFESNEEWISKQNEKIQPIFPDHLGILCFSNVRSWWRQFENAKKIVGEPPIEMSESLVHRNIHTITTVIQFEHPRVSNGPGGGIGGQMSPNGSPILEMAGRRFVETLVSIVEHSMYEDMCNHWIKAVVKKTNMYDVEGVFCLLDFLDTLIMELDGRDSIDTSNDHLNPDNININLSTSFSSISSSNSSSSSTGGLINILDIPFYLSLIKLLLNQSDHTITLLRTISFIYTHFCLFTSKPSYLGQLVKDLLLEEEMFERLFCHWSRNVRVYFMRLLVWRVSRVVGGIGFVDRFYGTGVGNGGAGIFEEEKRRKQDGEPIDSGVAVGVNAEESMIEIVLFTLQSRIENIRLCHEIFSDDIVENRGDEDAIGKGVEEEAKSSLSTLSSSSSTHTAISSKSSPSENQPESLPPSTPSSTPTRQNSNQKRKMKMSAKSLIAMRSSASASTSVQSTTKTKTAATNPNNTITNSITNNLVLDSTSRSKPATKSKPRVTHYAPHRHVYASKAIQEFDAVNQEYLEWCAQTANTRIHNGNNLNINGNGASINESFGSGGINNNNTGILSMLIRFPGLVVEYPKYFGTGGGSNGGIPMI
ncbi:9393_t:CDS:10 [Ambispora gerdemannii]|uniref:9393_t:CDS:1 n=1 Tax=Ambispora gerdemannii TaxID=144530 RepID=A0A9N9GB24_9GLOM|nr:9393_t:CDS:10 [Ambispora gerdemannii]